MGDGAARHGRYGTALRGAEPCRVVTRQNKNPFFFSLQNTATILKYFLDRGGWGSI